MPRPHLPPAWTVAAPRGRAPPAAKTAPPQLRGPARTSERCSTVSYGYSRFGCDASPVAGLAVLVGIGIAARSRRRIPPDQAGPFMRQAAMALQLSAQRRQASAQP